MTMSRPDRHVKKCRPDIHLAEPFTAVNFIGEITEQGQREDICHRPEVEHPEVRARPDPSPCLVGQVEGGAPLRFVSWLDFLNDSVSFYLVPSFFALLGLVRVGNDGSALGLRGRVVPGFNEVVDSVCGLALFKGRVE